VLQFAVKFNLREFISCLLFSRHFLLTCSAPQMVSEILRSINFIPIKFHDALANT